jgi:hypothetical protein
VYILVYCQRIDKKKFHSVINNDFKKMLTLFLNFPSIFFRRRLISVFVVLSMFTMILIDPYHDGFLERYNSLVSLYASFNSGNSFPRFSIYHRMEKTN